MTALAKVLPFPRAKEEPEPAKVYRIHRRRHYPTRKPRNGHHPDCPYPNTDAVTCRVCRSEDKGRP